MKCVNNYEASMDTFLSSEPLFHGYDAFIEYALKNRGCFYRILMREDKLYESKCNYVSYC